MASPKKTKFSNEYINSFTIKACKDCGSINIVEDVVDFCANCRSYNIDMKNDIGEFYLDTELYQHDLKSYKLQEIERKKQEEIKKHQTLQKYSYFLEQLENYKKLYYVYDDLLYSIFRVMSFKKPQEPELLQCLKNKRLNFVDGTYSKLKNILINNEYKYIGYIENDFLFLKKYYIDFYENCIEIFKKHQLLTEEEITNFLIKKEIFLKENTIDFTIAKCNK